MDMGDHHRSALKMSMEVIAVHAPRI